MSSRDGLRWDRRFMESIVRPGVGPRNWTSRNNLLSNGIVETGEKELSMYVLRHRDFPSVHFERVMWRKDGFVSANAGYGGGELVTRPADIRRRRTGAQLLHVGRRLYQGRGPGRRRPGDRGIRAGRLPGDVRRRDRRRCSVGGNGTDVSTLAGRPVRLRFELKDADLYAFRFRSRSLTAPSSTVLAGGCPPDDVGCYVECEQIPGLQRE